MAFYIYTASYAAYFFKTREGQFLKKMIEESVCSITKIIGNHSSKRNFCFFYLFFINKIIKPDKYLQKNTISFSQYCDYFSLCLFLRDFIVSTVTEFVENFLSLLRNMFEITRLTSSWIFLSWFKHDIGW